jgi:UPF0716 protein FxsA
MTIVVLIVAFVVVPLVELWVILHVAAQIGIFPTLAVLLTISILGGVLVKRIGVGVLQRARTTVNEGRIPGREMLDGTVVLGAGALLLVPGFVTDLCGLILLLPPIRKVVGLIALRRFVGTTAGHVRTVRVDSTWSPDGAGPSDVVEGELRRPPHELEP